MAKRTKESNLSAKISSVLNAAPDYGEEDDDFTKVSQLNRDEVGSDSGDELNLAQFRKINIELLDAEDKKYAGVISSRKVVNQEKAFGSDTSDESENEVDTGSVKSDTENEAETSGSNDGRNDVQEDDEISSDSSDDDSDDSSDDDDSDSAMSDKDASSAEEKSDDGSASEEEDNSHLNQLSAKIVSDIDKGNAIRNQLSIWDSLLECRIKFQKCLSMANKLPKTTKMGEFVEAGGEDFLSQQKLCQKSMKNVLKKFLELQTVCFDTNTKHHEGCSSKRSLNDDGSTSESDTTDEEAGFHLEKKRRKPNSFSDELRERHEAFIPFRNDTIQKWNDKTRVTQMGSKNFSAFEQSTLKQIEIVLADKSRLLKRTRTKRSNYQILGDTDDEPSAKVSKVEECPEIFDDDDFYHQLLRELLERKTSDVTDPVQLSRQWIQLQKVRNKMKKTVDTKASKGRKIRYDIHQKLVNFMMPIDNTTWTDEARSELLASLFGKKTVKN